MAGSPINPAMQQYLNGLNATVYSATAGLPTAGVGAGASAAPMNPYAAPGGYTAAPVAPPNTQFTGSQDMMNPAQQASNQANAQQNGQQNPPTKGEAVQNFVEDNQTALMVGGAALLAGGGFLAYRSHQNKKEAAASAAKSNSSSSSSGKPSPPTGDDKSSTRSSSDSARSTSSSSAHSNASSATSHNSSSSRSSSLKLGGKLKGLSLLGSLAPKRKTNTESFTVHSTGPANGFTHGNARQVKANDPNLSRKERKDLEQQDSLRQKDSKEFEAKQKAAAEEKRQTESNATLNKNHQELGGKGDFTTKSGDDQQKFVHGQKQTMAQRDQANVDALSTNADKIKFSNLSPNDRSYYNSLSATDRTKFLENPKAFQASSPERKPLPSSGDDGL